MVVRAFDGNTKARGGLLRISGRCLVGRGREVRVGWGLTSNGWCRRYGLDGDGRSVLLFLIIGRHAPRMVVEQMWESTTINVY